MLEAGAVLRTELARLAPVVLAAAGLVGLLAQQTRAAGVEVAQANCLALDKLAVVA
jgi:glucose-6-phosphate dehydrogenase assembly protein OpcA